MVARLAENLAPEGFFPNTTTEEEKTSTIFGQSESTFDMYMSYRSFISCDLGNLAHRV
jgi:hypothetical protein